MGLIDAISAEDRIEVKFSDFYNLIKGCTMRDLLLNGIKCDVPHVYLREMASGDKEPEPLPGVVDAHELKSEAEEPAAEAVDGA